MVQQVVNGADGQRTAYKEEHTEDDSRWEFHYTSDRLVRYLRDRRLKIALQTLRSHGILRPETQTVLVVCGGVGGEGTYLRKAGFHDVTVSDISDESLERCRRFDPALKTSLQDAERLDAPDDSYDLVVVQDGLHHLPSPTTGFTEMLRVARQAVIVIEPHAGIVGKVWGREWEVEGEAVNYVFRWNRLLMEQCTRSYLLSREAQLVTHRVWDHGSAVSRIVGIVPRPLRFQAAKAIYAMLGCAGFVGNMMIGVVIMGQEAPPERLTSH